MTNKKNEQRNAAVNSILETLWQFDKEDDRFMVLACALSMLIETHNRDPFDEACRMVAIHTALKEQKYDLAERVAKMKP
jgi:hypothetical protein